ncbi:hypothetical protein GCM10007977_104050 [Dactylosporangium sucinum]|uniref:LuxR family transcriptional regulator n=1 Tax=Dactylosporangium sucinum TaxID=1424081 RepID=A0A917UFF2_9ACTN|nr:hypothetical protein GCM10007977_104050 [Dactylosporangium sucinum]
MTVHSAAVAHRQRNDVDPRTGRSLAALAYALAAQIGHAEGMALALLELAGTWVHQDRGAVATARMEARLREVLRLLDPRSPLELRVRVRLAGEADYRTGQHAAVLEVLEEARRSADPMAWAEALHLAHHCVLGPDHGALRRALASELIGVSDRTGRWEDLLKGMLWSTVDQFLDGDRHAERQLRELRQLLTKREHLALSYVSAVMEVMLTIRAGDLDAAETLARRCVDYGTVAGDPDTAGWFGAQLVAIRWYQGRLPELLPLLDELAHTPTLSAVDNAYFAALAMAAATAGDRQRAAAALARLRGTGLAELPRSSSWLVTMYGAVEAAHLLHDTELAAEAYDLLRPYGHLPAIASLGVTCFGSVRHALGVAALTTGAIDRAVEHFAEAARHNLALGHAPAAALSRQRLAEALGLQASAGTQRANPATAGASGPVDGSQAARCTRRGRHWQVELGRRTVLVGHSVGMLHLAVLLANPGTEIPAADLVAGVNNLAANAGAADRSDQLVVDEVAIGQYRQRLAQVESSGATPVGNRSAGRSERDWLVDELRTVAGLGGRTRSFVDNAERARIAVGKAIRRAIHRVQLADPIIGAHLSATVHTGNRCVYRAG